MSPVRKPHPLPVQLLDLFLIELSNWRWSWRSLLITATLVPVLSILAFGAFAQGSGRGTFAYILTGNIVLSLMFGTLNNMQSHCMYMRVMGAFDVFATLPIRRSMLLLAMVLAFLLLSLPTLVVTIVLGALILHVPLTPSPLFLLVVPLCAVPLAGIGALIGVTARTPETGGALSLIVTAILVSLGPVVVPPSRLPGLVLAFGWISPATYAASAVRQTLLGPVTGRLALDLAVLLGLAILTLGLVSQRLDWRQR